MRVRAVLPLYPPGSLVGSWLTTHAFLRDLVDRGHDVEVLLYMDKRAGYTLDGVRVKAFPLERGESPRPAEAEDPDVVVHHLGDAGIGRACWPRAPHVLMVHGRDRAMQAQCETADLVVFNSLSARQEVQIPTDGTGPRWVIAHPPLDVQEVEHDPAERGKVTLVNTSIKKGGDTFRLLAATMRHEQFLGVAGGYGRQVTPRARNVELLPPQVDMAAVYRRTRVLLMPSLAESWGRTGLEAMTSGIPVIAHPTPGLRESLGEAGIFVDRAYVRGWRKALRDLDDPAAYDEASARARSHAAAFDSAAQLDTFASAVEALVADKAEAPS